MLSNKAAVHRADSRKVKNFIRSFGQRAKKTDNLDAKALSLYAYERQERLAPYQKTSKSYKELKLLIERRQDLKRMLVQEKNPFQAPLNKSIRAGIKTVIVCLEEQINNIEESVYKIVDKNKDPSV